MKLVYIASPYSHEDGMVVYERFAKARDYTAHLMRHTLSTGCVPFSPILHCHEMAQVNDLPIDHEYWMRVDKTFMRHCDEVWVLMLDGWNESKGVKMEIEFAESLMIPVKYCSNDVLKAKMAATWLRRAFNHHETKRSVK